MNKKIYIALGLVVLLGIGAWFILGNYHKQPAQSVSDYKNVAYLIDGKSILLSNGYSEIPIDSDSAEKITTQYFGNEALGDLNSDGIPDVGFILIQNTGGSGTFYYAVAALKTPNGYQGTNAIFLGDRIAPQTTQIKDGELVVNYADRKPTDPMTTKPSVGVSKYLKVVNSVLVEAK